MPFAFNTKYFSSRFNLRGHLRPSEKGGAACQYRDGEVGARTDGCAAPRSATCDGRLLARLQCPRRTDEAASVHGDYPMSWFECELVTGQTYVSDSHSDAYHGGDETRLAGECTEGPALIAREEDDLSLRDAGIQMNSRPGNMAHLSHYG